MDQYHRLVLTAEEKFFDKCDTGNGISFLLYFFCLSDCPIAVPVVVVFTKCDALLATAWGELTSEERQLSREAQLARIKEYKAKMLQNCTGWERLKARNYPPKACVYLESKC